MACWPRRSTTQLVIDSWQLIDTNTGSDLHRTDLYRCFLRAISSLRPATVTTYQYSVRQRSRAGSRRASLGSIRTRPRGDNFGVITPSKSCQWVRRTFKFQSPTVFRLHQFNLHSDITPVSRHVCFQKRRDPPHERGTHFTEVQTAAHITLAMQISFKYCPVALLSTIFFIFFSFLCRALDSAGHLVSFSVHVNIPYRIVS